MHQFGIRADDKMGWSRISRDKRRRGVKFSWIILFATAMGGRFHGKKQDEA
jgi:hypothetical protein